MNKALRKKAVELRVNKRMSYSAIGKKLAVSKSTLSYWLKEFPLREEEIVALRRKGWEKGEASRERFRNTMRKKRTVEADAVYMEIKKKIKDETLSPVYSAGLMLYAAEGAKKDDYRIIIANTDARLIKFFMTWLETYLEVAMQDLRFQLHLYENMNVQAEKKYWLQTLGITQGQLYKVQIRTLRPHSFSYISNDENRHGTCSLQYSSREKKQRLMMGIKAFLHLHS